MRQFLVSCLSCLLLPTLVLADGYNSKRIPADAKWVLHLDMDAAKASKGWDVLDRRLANENFRARTAQMEQLTGMRFPQDMHDLTIVGRAPGEDGVTMLLHAQFDTDKIATAIADKPNLATQTVGPHDIISWDDAGRRNSICLVGKELLVMSRSVPAIQAALDTLDGKSPAVAASSPLAYGDHRKLLMYVAASDLAAVQRPDAPQNPVTQNLDHGWLTVSELRENIVVEASLVGKSQEAAEQLMTAVEGGKTMLSVAAANDTAEERVKNAAAAIAPLNATLDGNTVHIDLPIPQATFFKLFDPPPQPRPAPAGAQ